MLESKSYLDQVKYFQIKNVQILFLIWPGLGCRRKLFKVLVLGKHQWFRCRTKKSDLAGELKFYVMLEGLALPTPALNFMIAFSGVHCLRFLLFSSDIITAQTDMSHTLSCGIKHYFFSNF